MAVPPNVPQHVIEDLAMEQAVSRASSLAPSAAHRSPSAVPAMELDEMVSQEEQTTSERYRSLLPSIEEQQYAHHQPSSQQTASVEADTDRIILPVALLGHQRDQYQTTQLTDGERSIQRLKDILIHPDLDNIEALEQADVDHDQQLEWDTQSSAKLRWLRSLLTRLWSTEQHIVVTISSKRQQVLQRFLTALHAYLSASQGPRSLNITCLTEETENDPQNASLVIMLDDVFPEVTGSPVIQLVVPYSIEQIELDESNRLAPSELLDTVRAFRQQAGRLEETLLDTEATTAYIADVLVNHSSQMVFQIPQLTRLEAPTALTNGHAEPSGKRAYDDSEDESLPAKRMKSEDPSVMQTDEAQLSALLVAEQDRRAELEVNLGDLQYRFEEMQKQVSEVTEERDAAIETAQKAVTRMNDQADNLRSLKTGMAALREQLADCETRLVSHTVPERAELETLRQAASKAAEGEAKATAKLEGIRKDLLYAQSLYQDVSTKASGLAGENEVLTKQLAVAEAAASKERARLRQMGFDNVAKQLNRENKQLRAMLELREIAITTRDEEISRLKDSNRGRMGTRGTSVPRSPRMSSPLKTMDTRLTGSRHGSPAAGDARMRAHPLRNG